jgi:hypothetical protein
LNTELEVSISKLMFLSASITGGGLEPKYFLMRASCSGNKYVCTLYLSKRNRLLLHHLLVEIFVTTCFYREATSVGMTVNLLVL